MRIFIYEHKYIIGFANSLEELKEVNNKRSYPYSYDWDKVTSKELDTDIFSLARIEGMSNFVDYLNY